MNTPAKFWALVDKTDGCWYWTGSRVTDGYGQIMINRVAKRTHRYAWELTFGQIPKGQCVCHTCDIRHCVNPAHLFLGSNNDNIQDRNGKNRQAKGSGTGKAKLTEAAVKQIRKSYKHKAMSTQQLANVFGVSKRQINTIVAFEQWKHVKE